MHLYSDAQMHQRGYTHRAGFVSVTNYASLEMGKHMGVIPIGHAGFCRLFGKTRFFRSRAVRAIGFRFYSPDATD